MSSKKSLAFAGPREDAALTATKSHWRSPGTTPVIRDSVHLQPCAFQDMNSIALAARGRSAVNSSTFAQRSRHRFVPCTHDAHVARVLFRPPTQDTWVCRNHCAGDFLPPPPHDLHGAEAAVPRPQQVPVCKTVVYRPQGYRLTSTCQRRVGPGARPQRVSLHIPDMLEGLHGGHMRFEHPFVPRYQEGCMLLWQQEMHKRGLRVGRSKARLL